MAELAKRTVIADIISIRNFPRVDVSIGTEDGSDSGYVQVKASSFSRSRTFALDTKTILSWIVQPRNMFVVFVWLGHERDSPIYWMATMEDAGRFLEQGVRSYQRKKGVERMQYWVAPDEESGLTKGKYARLNKEWRDRWDIFDRFRCDHRPNSVA